MPVVTLKLKRLDSGRLAATAKVNGKPQAGLDPVNYINPVVDVDKISAAVMKEYFSVDLKP